MKYLRQATILAAVTFAAELIHYLLPLPVPTSIYGLVMLFLLLKTGLLKLSDVEDVGNFLLEIMPLIMVPASVSFIEAMDTIQAMILPVLIMGFLGTILVLFVTGHVAQWVKRHGKGGESHD